jgi:hypothetical protein
VFDETPDIGGLDVKDNPVVISGALGWEVEPGRSAELELLYCNPEYVVDSAVNSIGNQNVAPLYSKDSKNLWFGFANARLALVEDVFATAGLGLAYDGQSEEASFAYNAGAGLTLLDLVDVSVRYISADGAGFSHWVPMAGVRVAF